MRIDRIAALGLAAALTFAACGGDDGDESADTTTTTEDDTEAGADATTTTTAAPDDGAGVDADEEAYVDALVTSFTSEGAFGDALEEDEVRCMSLAFVRAANVEELQAAGVAPEDFANTESESSMDDLGIEVTDDEADDLRGEIDDCGIDFVDFYIGALAAAAGTDEEAQAQLAAFEDCFRGAVTSDELRDDFVNDFRTSDAPDSAADEALSSCISASQGG
ncbi:MAG: hypothetical protein ACRD0G_19515 [Acidimicrobiales bacterium]